MKTTKQDDRRTSAPTSSGFQPPVAGGIRLVTTPAVETRRELGAERRGCAGGDRHHHLAGVAAGAQVGSRARPLDLIAAREPQRCMAQTQSGRRNINPSPRAIRSIRPRRRRKIGRSGLSVRKARFLMETPSRSSALFPGPQESPE
jgi:hypothetical protein